jgi:hypothetical protein
VPAAGQVGDIARGPALDQRRSQHLRFFAQQPRPEHDGAIINELLRLGLATRHDLPDRSHHLPARVIAVLFQDEVEGPPGRHAPPPVDTACHDLQPRQQAVVAPPLFRPLGNLVHQPEVFPPRVAALFQPVAVNQPRGLIAGGGADGVDECLFVGHGRCRSWAGLRGLPGRAEAALPHHYARTRGVFLRGWLGGVRLWLPGALCHFPIAAFGKVLNSQVQQGQGVTVPLCHFVTFSTRSPTTGQTTARNPKLPSRRVP